MLCAIITRTKDIRRKLFTDNEMMRYDLCQPIILNGIYDVVKEPDMLSWSIVMNILKPTDKGSFAYDKVVLTEEFMNDRAVILGSIFRILSEALKNYRPNSIPRQGCDIRVSSFYDYYICEAWRKGTGIEFFADYITLLNYQLKDFLRHYNIMTV